MTAIVIDIIIVLILAWFTWRGARKGLILTLFSLLAVFAAWFGAKAVTQHFTEPVAGIIRPSIQLAIEEAVTGGETGTDSSPSASPSPSPSPSPASGSSPAGMPGGPSESSPAVGAELTLQDVLEVLEQSRLFTGLRGFVEEAVEQEALNVATTALDAVSAYIARLIAGVLLFAASFLLILLVWFLVSRALDLAFHLPILALINAIGGGVLGLVKGVVLALLLVWLAGLAGFITEGTCGPVAGFFSFRSVSGLLRSLIQGAAGLPSAAAQIYHASLLDLFINI